MRWLTAWTVAGGGDSNTRRDTSLPAAFEAAAVGLWAAEVAGAADDVEGASLPLRVRSRELRKVSPSVGAEAKRSRMAADGAAVLPACGGAKPSAAAAAAAAAGGDGLERKPHAMRTHASCTADGLM